MPSDASVVIVEDDVYAHEGLKLLLARDRFTRVVGSIHQVSTARAVVERVAQHSPQVVVLDMDFPGRPDLGIDIVRSLRRSQRSVLLLCLSNLADAASICSALEEGIDGYVLKKECGRAIATAVRMLDTGRLVATPAIVQVTFGETNRLRRKLLMLREPEWPSAMPDRLKEVASCWCVYGMSCAEIADELQLSKYTVRGYVKALYGLLGVNAKAEARSWAFQAMTDNVPDAP